VGQPEQVAVADALALAVLDRLVGESVDRPSGVPAADRTPQRAAPAAEALDERREPKQVRARAGRLRQRLESGLAGRLVARACSQREGEEGRIVLRRPTLVADARDLRDRAHAVRR
jgi:hypothetical protein